MIPDIKRAAGEIPSSGEPRRWDEWTAEELAALWPKHDIKPVRYVLYRAPNVRCPQWAACAVGILTVDVCGRDAAERGAFAGVDVSEDLADRGYPQGWVAGLVDGFNQPERNDDPTVEYDMGYRLGQRVAALVFEAVPQ